MTAMDRKKLVSIRVRAQDVDKIKDVSRRMGVRESELLRFAIKLLLGRLAPLRDPELRGRDLVPLLMEHGTELANYFELDAERLARVVNHGVDAPSGRVDVRDIEMLIASNSSESYVHLRPREGGAPSHGGSGGVKQYLYEKYLASETTSLRAAAKPLSG